MLIFEHGRDSLAATLRRFLCITPAAGGSQKLVSILVTRNLSPSDLEVSLHMTTVPAHPPPTLTPTQHLPISPKRGQAIHPPNQCSTGGGSAVQGDPPGGEGPGTTIMKSSSLKRAGPKGFSEGSCPGG